MKIITPLIEKLRNSFSFIYVVSSKNGAIIGIAIGSYFLISRSFDVKIKRKGPLGFLVKKQNIEEKKIPFSQIQKEEPLSSVILETMTPDTQTEKEIVSEIDIQNIKAEDDITSNSDASN